MIGQFKQKSETLVLPHQLLLRGLRRIKMQRVVECESDLLSHYRKKLNFLGRIDIRSFTGKRECSDFCLWAVVKGRVHTERIPYFFKISWNLQEGAWSASSEVIIGLLF